MKFFEADVKSFSEKEEVLTRRLKLHRTKLFKEFLASEEEMQKIEEIPEKQQIDHFRVHVCLVIKAK